MLLIMLVSLYTVRVLLNTLGVIDFGLYNVIGGIVVMFSFLSNTMATASQRFFAFEIGQNNILKLKQTFSLTFTIYVIIAIVVLLLAETLGVWFLNTQMVVPIDRMEAANWIYQFSIFSFIITILTIPYNAMIIARENMAVYAYVSILEVICKLIVVYLLLVFSVDKLKLYAVLIFCTTCVISYIYLTICKRKYEECQFRFYFNKGLFNTLINFSGWNLLGTISGIANNQGNNILINIFFGPKINAARAIAFQINSAVSSFSSNFYTAVKPQLVKSYAENNNKYMMNLFYMSSKLSYFLLLFFCLPVLVETEYILNLWLTNTTDYMIIFTRLIIVYTMILSLQNPITALVHATGQIKKYHIIVEIVTLLCLPISYLFLKLGYPAEFTLYTSIVIFAVAHFIRLWILKGLIKISINNYLKHIISILIMVTLISLIPLIAIKTQLEYGFIRFIIIIIVSTIAVITNSFFIGLTQNEKNSLIEIIKSKLVKMN